MTGTSGKANRRSGLHSTEEREPQGDDIVMGTHFQGQLNIGAGTEEYQCAGGQVKEDDGRYQVEVQDDGGRKLRGRDIVKGVNFDDVTGGVPDADADDDAAAAAE